MLRYYPRKIVAVNLQTKLFVYNIRSISMIRWNTLVAAFVVGVLGSNLPVRGQIPLPPTHEIEVELPKADERNVVNYTRPFASANHQTMNFDSKLKPFYHGVASGDPLHDRVILWTRVTPDTDGEITVQWKIATDTALAKVVQSGTTTTNQALDYTVKIDAVGLQPNTTYYYGFEALGRKSLTGRTRTAPVDGVQQLRFAVVSCSNYQQGFFNAYARIAERKDIDAVIHLGDYIYEYADGGYGYTKEVGRGHEPKTEVISLSDYRIRHSFYKLDPDLRRAHQQHPFIAIWDDHETANDSYKDGANNHDSATEGSWQERKLAAEKAYFEWMPIRRKAINNNQIYRSISYGHLMDLILVDTRLEGREKQLGGKDTTGKTAIDTALWKSSGRTLLGLEQQQWLLEQLQQSKATWKILANQVMMMQVEAQALGLATNLDAWDGYPAEREKIYTFLQSKGIKNLVVLTGDIHCSWAANLTFNPFDSTKYSRLTGEGSLAVEFVTPSISSANIDELLNVKGRTPFIQQAEGVMKLLNPHLKDVELTSHGYFILDVNPSKTQADYFFSDSINVPVKTETFWKGFSAPSNDPRITVTSTPAPTKPNAPDFAPNDPPQGSTSVFELKDHNDDSHSLLVLGVYPNPANTIVTIGYALTAGLPVSVKIFDAGGNEIMTALNTMQEAGTYSLVIDTKNITNGTYFCTFTTTSGVATRAFVVRK